MDMGKRIKKLSFWFRRRSYIPVLLIGGLVVALLFFNEDASVSLNMEYQNEINRLRAEIKECRDSAAYYRNQRESLSTGTEELEHLAREKYHMQKPTEDVFVIK